MFVWLLSRTCRLTGEVTFSSPVRVAVSQGNYFPNSLYIDTDLRAVPALAQSGFDVALPAWDISLRVPKSLIMWKLAIFWIYGVL